MTAMPQRLVPLLGLLLALAIAGCLGSDSDKAGGEREAEPVVLTMANALDGSEEIEPYTNAVERLSGGTVRINVRNNWARGRSDYETRLIRDVAAGKADLGWVGSRAWDTVGVKSFRALTAPFLVDSHSLQERVLRGAVAKEMLRGVGPLGLVGLGVLPGPLRKPLGTTAALVEPSDYAGLTIGVQQSRLADATMRALGAKPVWFPAGGGIERFDAIEQQISSIEGNRYDTTGKYLTANLTLWPRPLVPFANGKAFRSLDSGQRRALVEAAANVIADYTAANRGVEREAGDVLCRRGLRFVSASSEDLAALRRAVEPVYAMLRRDGETKSFIARIEALRKEATPARSETPRCLAATTEQAARKATPIDGEYRMTTTREELAKADPDEEPLSENYGRWRLVLDRGRLRYTQSSEGATRWTKGVYTVRGHTLVMKVTDYGGEAPNDAAERTGEVFTFRWSRYRDTLTLGPVPGAISPQGFRLKPWRRVD
jgi:TRAP-type transport system periplasmic protein